MSDYGRSGPSSREETSDPSPSPRHLEGRTRVWNLTVKPIRVPNGQIIWGVGQVRLPDGSRVSRQNWADVMDWEVWKGADVVRAWLETGALTETDPAGSIDAVAAERGLKRSLTSPAPSVFTGKREFPARSRSREKAPENGSSGPGAGREGSGPSQ